MTKLLKSLLMVAALMSMAGLASALDSNQFRIPKDRDQNLAGNLDFVGVSVSSKSVTNVVTPNGETTTQTTGGKQWVSGKGVLYGVELATAAATTYVVCIDSDSTNTADITDLGNNFLFMPWFGNTTNASCVGSGTTGSAGCGWKTPREFRYGVMCWTNVNTRYLPLFRKFDQ